MSVPRLLEQAGCPEHLLDGPIGDIIAIDPLVVHKRTSVIDVMAALESSPWPVVLTLDHGRHAAITRADIDLLMPSPATTLARDELVHRVDRVPVSEAIRHATPTVESCSTVGAAIDAMSQAHWRPVVVMEGGRPAGVHTVESLLNALTHEHAHDRIRHRPAPARLAAPRSDQAAPASTVAAKAIPLSTAPHRQPPPRRTAGPGALYGTRAAAFAMPIALEVDRRRESYDHALRRGNLLSDLASDAGVLMGAARRMVHATLAVVGRA